MCEYQMTSRLGMLPDCHCKQVQVYKNISHIKELNKKERAVF